MKLMYAYAKEKTKPQYPAQTAAPSEEEILEQLRFNNFPKDDLKTILDKIKQLNPKLKQPHLLVAKYRSGAAANSQGSANAASSKSASSATTGGYKFSSDIVDGALYLYAINKGALFINSLIRKAKGQDIDIPDSTKLAREAKREFEVGTNPAAFAPGIDIKRVIKTLSEKSNAVAIMNQAAEEAKSSGMNTYYRGTKHRPVLNAIGPGVLVSANFLMSVTQDKKTAEKFSSGKYNSLADLDEFGVIYDITGNPKDFKYGDAIEKESIFPVGTKFKYIGRTGATYRFVEQSAAEVKKYKGDIYRLYR
ncbi:hypothetical protein IAE49_00230 [Kosakonia sp. S58]|uniref:hypothetical protein n=2 Tax=unclassified Kosakonia TaxID=2632876 RepID=UPI001908BD9A|nr:hypothetical protein [Kosakonia sp. S57]MBK0084669.1 hypothetical protein [Kosakonia sp. S58]